MARSNSFYNFDMLILSVLMRKDCYGYEIVKMLKEISNDTIIIKEGTLYPIVHNLLKDHKISSKEVIVNRKVRVYYHIEDEGKVYLKETIHSFKNSIESVFKIIDFEEHDYEE